MTTPRNRASQNWRKRQAVMRARFAEMEYALKWINKHSTDAASAALAYAARVASGDAL